MDFTDIEGEDKVNTCGWQEPGKLKVFGNVPDEGMKGLRTEIVKLGEQNNKKLFLVEEGLAILVWFCSCWVDMLREFGS